MKTPEEIKKGLECCTPKWMGNHWKSCSSKCPYITLAASCRGQLAYDALAYIQQLEDHIRDLTKMVPKWISVEERLPNIEETVIVAADDGYVYAAQLFGNGCWRKEQIGCIRADTGVVVTHWMPLPEPPKEG